MRASIRDYRPEDLPRVLDLWQRSGLLPVGADGLTLDQAVDLMSSAPAVTLVAELEGDVVGVAIGTAASVVGWIYRVTIAPELGDAQVTDQLLERLEGALAERGARKLSTVVAVRDAIVEQLEGRGYRLVERLRYLERQIPATVPVRAALVEVGGRMIDPGLWGELKGLEHWKEIIERRVILPLAEPDLAARHAVSPPRAIVLFGPPGTGKTTFAKGIASRLAWPFVEIQPAELAGEGAEREAGLLAEAFDRVRELSAGPARASRTSSSSRSRASARRPSTCSSARPTGCAASIPLSCDRGGSTMCCPSAHPIARPGRRSGDATWARSPTSRSTWIGWSKRATYSRPLTSSSPPARRLSVRLSESTSIRFKDAPSLRTSSPRSPRPGPRFRPRWSRASRKTPGTSLATELARATASPSGSEREEPVGRH